MHKAFSCLGALLLLFSARTGAEPGWAVHEWGTFTSLQDESGQAIGGINTDDEPVPSFVHRLDSFVLLRPTEIPNDFFQGAPSCHPDVTMRLETPVIYFHPPPSDTETRTADVRVTFHGGWLSEFYPDAVQTVPGLVNGRFQFGRLGSDTDSQLEWNDLKIGGDGPLTNTSAHVWISPRAVQAAVVQTTNGESEKFLFYRGVAHLDAPLKISQSGGQLVFRSQLEGLATPQPLLLHSIWLVDVRADGTVAFRPLPSLTLDADASKVLTHMPAAFKPGEFSSGNLEKLKASLHAALVAEGLFDDEARALLNTWELSYFKSAGLRVFFLVPRAWTDFHLPLQISLPAPVNRVMVGRIELVTPGQRERLQEMARFTPLQIQQEFGKMSTNFLASAAVSGSEWQQLAEGRKRLADVIPVPRTYQTYLDLGRFRNALVLDQAKRDPTEGLTNFITAYHLQAYQPAVTPPAH
jgi:hypothetical protein